MPSFAELKAKAAGMTSAGVEKVQNVRDRNTSVPLKKTNWDPYNGRPPPPPPPRSNPNTKPQPPLLPPPSRTGSTASSTVTRANSSPAPALPSRSISSGTPPPPPLRTPSSSSPALPSRSSASGTPPPPPSAFRGRSPAGPPPIIQRSTRPDGRPKQQVPLVPPPVHAAPAIDWANLSPEDKEIFFSWLDEFFAHFKQKLVAKSDDAIPQGKPPLRPTNKPSSWSNSQAGSQSSSMGVMSLSHPPATRHGSAAADLAHFFAPSNTWKEAWYKESPSIPPPLKNDTHHMYMASWTSWGPKKTVSVGVLFSDLSAFWGTVDFMTSDPENPRTTSRKAVYITSPKALDQVTLVEAHETYNETIALFAESFLGSGQCCGRGECWDLANEALKYLKEYNYIPKPVPSISRTHGHLIYEGRASDKGKKSEGRWRGGDDRVRRGDIVEWRRVRISCPGGFSTLGDPDHTAIIVADIQLKTVAGDGVKMPPADLGILTVVEQSQGRLPARRDYDLSFLEDGEIWIYRPVGMEVYLGISELSAVAPDGHAGLQQL